MSRGVDSPRGPCALINQSNPWWLGQQPGGEIQAGTTCDTQQRALPRLWAPGAGPVPPPPPLLRQAVLANIAKASYPLPEGRELSEMPI